MRRFATLVLLATVAACSDSSTAPDRPVSAVTITPGSASLLTGNTVRLSAKVTGGYANPVVTWSSSNPSLATVTDSGVVSAIGAGSVTISATSGGVSGTAALTISAGSISVAPSAVSLVVGQSQLLGATLVVGGTRPTVVWTSSNANIAAVNDSGRVTARGAGTATITAVAGTLTATATVSVTAGAVDRISVCDKGNTATCSDRATLGGIGASVVARATAYNAFNGDITSSCTFAWAPNSNGVVSVAFVAGDASKRDALITRTGYGIISIVVTCSGIPAVFTIDGPLTAPTLP